MKLQISLALMEKQIEKDISKRLDDSISKIDRKLNDTSSHTILRHQHLPTSMNLDKFKTIKDTKGKMTFIIIDNDVNNRRNK